MKKEGCFVKVTYKSCRNGKFVIGVTGKVSGTMELNQETYSQIKKGSRISILITKS